MLLYRILITLAAPILVIALFVRVLRAQESFGDFKERMGFGANVSHTKVTWLHAASNGEMTSARPLIDGILKSGPTTRLLLTCNSVTAKKMLLSWRLEQVEIRLAPFDLRWMYQRFLSRLDVTQFILIEGDFWPNRMSVLQSRNIPTALIAGRMSAKSARKWQRFPMVCKRMLSSFDLTCPQDTISQDRLVKLGVQPRSIGPQISLKSLFKGQTRQIDHVLRAQFWLAASTHEGEDETLLKAHKHARAQAPSLRLILAPRHPKRASQIAQTARTMGLSITQRSTGDQLLQPSDVYLADTLGEMEKWYQTAATCFVAGSLVEKGGHTPFEPMSFDCAILHGTHLENFEHTYRTLDAMGGARLCRTAVEISDAVIALLDIDLAKEQCQNARNALGQIHSIDPVLNALSQISKT